jgi:tetratricopeptide (TPR) repeat protein
MPQNFDLIITADYSSRSAEFRLLDAHGVQLAYNLTDFKVISVSHQQGLFDLRNYLRLYVEEGKKATTMAEIGICIAEEVLGKDLFPKLWKSVSQRTLRILLPDASDEKNQLAAALARVPWEIARPSLDQPTLGERNVVIRVVHDMREPASHPVELAPDEPLRVLFVFAEARGSRPLGARQERLELLRLFEKEIYPQRRIVAHFLTHGVTRERLIEQIQQNNGYHVVHWSGHGNLNLLELAKPGGAKDPLSGNELLDLFSEAGGFPPRLFFLSACHSGDILRVKDWQDFLAIAQGKEPGAKDADMNELDLQDQPGFTGTAHALLHGGVTSVVAMRYAVGDDYARELGVEFYRALLAHAQPKNAAAALTMARQSMLDAKRHDPSRFAVCAHATPVLYGAEQPGLTLATGRSTELDLHNPRLHRISELTMAEHEHFVGRTWELAGLGSNFIGARMGAEVQPVAVITGLGGMGKTSLAAEALALWENRFAWVLLYQAKPNALGFDAFLRDIHLKLMGELGRYHDHVKAHPADAVHRDACADFTGPERLERLTCNLVHAFGDEPVLLVLDNFETNLKPAPETKLVDGKPVWACQDPSWDRCLAALVMELRGSPSRVLITCRRPLAALSAGTYHPVMLGPLPPAEAALYLRSHPALCRMVFGGDAQERELAERLLTASRFHPLLMGRLARLAADPALRPRLLQALDTLENTRDFHKLPALFATIPGDEKELAYLDDALSISLDHLIQDASPDARRLLWIIAVANEPVALGLLKGVWSGEGLEQQQLRRLKQMFDVLPQLPPEVQTKLDDMPAEIRAKLDALPPDSPDRPAMDSLLRPLVAVGLATEERTGPDDDNPGITCHELVRDRILAWMGQHPDDQGGLTENTIRLAYAERLEAVFDSLRHRNMTVALQAGSRALVYCVQAGAWDRLGGFAGDVVTGTNDPRLLERLTPHLRAAADAAPEGRSSWSCLCYLADALNNGGCPDRSLPFYEQAAAQARAVAEAGGEGSRQAWKGVAWISCNWAGALVMSGNLAAARERQIESAEAHKESGSPAIHIIGSELEALRIDIQQGRVETALPEVETRLARVEAWWRLHRTGQAVPEAPGAEFLARVFIGALDIASGAYRAQDDWESALRQTERSLEVKRALERSEEDIAGDRMNRAVVLGRLRRFGEARAELEMCLEAFKSDPARSAKTFSSLAYLSDEQGDLPQAITLARRALAQREQLPDPADRAISHNNLANYLERSATPADPAEAPRHQLAALVYKLVAGLGQHLRTSLRNYAIDFRRARSRGAELAVPCVAELLADPAFHPLKQWLQQRQVGAEQLQGEVDHFLELARQAALQQESATEDEP